MRLVHVHQDHSVLGSHFGSDLSIACSPIELLDGLGRFSVGTEDRSDWINELRSVKAKGTTQAPSDAPDGVPFEFVVRAVAETLPADAIITVDAGTFAAPIYRAIRFDPPQRLLAPISGAMGYGIPAAVAASLRHPERPVICFVGDGGLLMTCAELAVAAERKLQIKVIVSENRSYGSIRIHQEKDYPGRTVGTTLHNPDLAGLAKAFGFTVTRMNSVDQLDSLSAALRADGPQFILVRSSLSAVLPKPVQPQRTEELVA
jgi:acetolactate synthase-1/2/3 large subunit